MAAELQESQKDVDVEMVPSSGGVFEVTYDGKLVFSKKATGRFPNKGEVTAQIAK